MSLASTSNEIVLPVIVLTNKDPHAAVQTHHQMKCRTFLDVVVRESPAVLQLFSSEAQSLLIQSAALLVLQFCFDVINDIEGLHVEGDGFFTGIALGAAETALSPNRQFSVRLFIRSTSTVSFTIIESGPTPRKLMIYEGTKS